MVVGTREVDRVLCEMCYLPWTVIDHRSRESNDDLKNSISLRESEFLCYVEDVKKGILWSWVSSSGCALGGCQEQARWSTDATWKIRRGFLSFPLEPIPKGFPLDQLLALFWTIVSSLHWLIDDLLVHYFKVCIWQLPYAWHGPR